MEFTCEVESGSASERAISVRPPVIDWRLDVALELADVQLLIEGALARAGPKGQIPSDLRAMMDAAADYRRAALVCDDPYIAIDSARLAYDLAYAALERATKLSP